MNRSRPPSGIPVPKASLVWELGRRFVAGLAFVFGVATAGCALEPEPPSTARAAIEEGDGQASPNTVRLSWYCVLWSPKTHAFWRDTRQNSLIRVYSEAVTRESALHLCQEGTGTLLGPTSPTVLTVAHNLMNAELVATGPRPLHIDKRTGTPVSNVVDDADGSNIETLLRVPAELWVKSYGRDAVRIVFDDGGVDKALRPGPLPNQYIHSSYAAMLRRAGLAVAKLGEQASLDSRFSAATNVITKAPGPQLADLAAFDLPVLGSALGGSRVSEVHFPEHTPSTTCPSRAAFRVDGIRWSRWFEDPTVFELRGPSSRRTTVDSRKGAYLFAYTLGEHYELVREGDSGGSLRYDDTGTMTSNLVIVGVTAAGVGDRLFYWRDPSGKPYFQWNRAANLGIAEQANEILKRAEGMPDGQGAQIAWFNRTDGDFLRSDPAVLESLTSRIVIEGDRSDSR